MRTIQIQLPDFLCDELQRYVDHASSSIDDVLCKALSDYLHGQSNTLFQISTSSALVEGVCQGAVSLLTLLQHGDLGLGTFENLDGEMIVVDGECFQARSDGSVQKIDGDVMIPFAVVTKFVPTQTLTADCASFEDLQSRINKMRDSDNLLYALKITGVFDYIHLRAVCKTKERETLVHAAELQSEFKYENLEGTLVGFWSPQYLKTVNIPGYHLHFLSRQHLRGGHLLDFRARQLQISIQRESAFSVVLPESEAFKHADFTADPSAALKRSETKLQH